MSEFRLESHPTAESYRLLDFDSVDVRPGIATDTYFLIVRGTKPCSNMDVILSPRVYIRCPEYWEIEVVGHLPHGICLTAMGEYEERIELTGITGSRGIEVVGATKTEQREVPGGCSGDGDLSTREAKTGYIVIALTASASGRNEGCSVVPESASYPAIYSPVFGPASQSECQRWVSENCGFEPGDPAE